MIRKCYGGKSVMRVALDFQVVKYHLPHVTFSTGKSDSAQWLHKWAQVNRVYLRILHVSHVCKSVQNGNLLFSKGELEMFSWVCSDVPVSLERPLVCVIRWGWAICYEPWNWNYMSSTHCKTMRDKLCSWSHWMVFSCFICFPDLLTINIIFHGFSCQSPKPQGSLKPWYALIILSSHSISQLRPTQRETQGLPLAVASATAGRHSQQSGSCANTPDIDAFNA